MYRLLLIVSLFLFSGCAVVQSAPDDQGDVLQVININGEIDEHMVDQVTKDVDKATSDRSVKGVLLVVDSPGGGMTAIAEVYEQLERIKVPVVGWCEHVCASGGMYVLMAPSVRFIGARTGTIAGSIGVISKVVREPNKAEQAGVTIETYKSGARKDAHDPYREATPQEKAYLQRVVDELAQVFYGVVAKARGDKISPAHWVEVKTARIWYAAAAVEVGLIDAVMTRTEAIAKASTMTGSKTIVTRE